MTHITYTDTLTSSVASRFLHALAEQARLLDRPEPVRGGAATGPSAFLDIDDTIIEVHGHQKQGAGFGYCRVRGLNALLATLTATGNAPVIVGQRLRKGACGSPRGAKRIVRDALAMTGRLLGPGHPSSRALLRADSAFYGTAVVHAGRTGGAHVSITVRLDSSVKKSIGDIPARVLSVASIDDEGVMVGDDVLSRI